MTEAASSHDPRKEYTDRLEARRRVVTWHDRLHIRFGNVRLAVAAAAAVLAWLAFSRDAISGWWLLAPAAIFMLLASTHDRVLSRRSKADRAVRFYTRGLERLDHTWMGKGEAGLRFRDESHPYAADLDLFGQGGLFELLCTARTRAGEEALARWLLAPATLAEIRDRHAAIDELRFRLDLREDLALLGFEARSSFDSEPLPKWGEQPPLLDSGPMRVLASALAVVALAAFAGWLAFGLTARMFLGVLVLEAAFGFATRRKVLRAVQAVEQPAHDLALMAEVLRRLERERFASPRLQELRRALETRGHPPSWHIARLNRLLELLESRDHLVVRIIGPPLMWTTQLAFAIEAWRKRSGPAVRRWIAAVGEIGALSALAGYAYEHPADPFPEFSEDGPLFDGEGLGHPLIAGDRCVCNDVRLDQGLRVLVVSGSNMSGKSTLLRTVGVNAVLAMAGAPVRARRLRLSPFVIGATIRITDSLQAGSSRFYAEITRLRQLVDLTRGPRPLLFLLDELLHGTNSRDRCIGGEAVVRSLVERGAVGLMTTHDLALTEIADRLDPHGANVHFEDHLEDGKITFDYLKRDGVVQKSNALGLMRSIGLDV
ncbi:MAG: DNA mismatch repair protein MutS [Acidobacteria bacterium]|nr:DNA mismatch repair protein MutS [Acidobacteriota bacterium]